MKKSFSIILCLALAVQIVLLGTFMTSAAAPAECNDLVFVDEFNNELFWTPAENEIYVTEMPHWGAGVTGTGNDGWDKATSPELQDDGSMLFEKYDGMSLYWENIDGFELSADKTYTISFDVEMISKSSDAPVRGTDWNREFYFGLGGYYNQVEFRSKARPHMLNSDTGLGIRAGDKVAGVYDNGGWNQNVDYTLDKYSAEVVWSAVDGTVVSTVKLGDEIIAQGQRNNSGNGYWATDAHAKLWTWRCESGSFKLSNVVVSDGTTDFVADFANDFTNKDDVLKTLNWSVEGPDYGTKNNKATKPTIADGLLKLDTYDSVTFNYKRLMDNNGVTYSSTTPSYTFEFDARVTISGTLVNGTWDNNPAHTGVLYVAFGGYHDQVRINTNEGKVYIGDNKSTAYTEEAFLNKWVHITVVLNGKNITSTMTDADGNVIATGTRTKDVYATMNDDMISLALRCEDGAIDIDNFKFIVDDSSVTTDHTPDEDKRQDPVTPDCGNAGNTGDTVCKVCGAAIPGEPVPATGEHDYNPDTDWKDEVPATCDQPGTLGYYHCDTCNKNFDINGDELTDLTIPAGHDYGEWNEEEPATCTVNGTVGHYFCDGCDTYFDEDYNVIDEADLVIEAGHTCGEWNDEVPATCTENGTVGYYYCSVCEKYLDEEYEEIADITISAGHNYGDIIPEDPATCTEKGTVAHYHCSACNKDFDTNKNEISSTLVDEKGHSFGDWTVTKEATVDEEGEKKRECANCDHFETKKTAKLTPPATENTDTNANTDNATNDTGADATEPASSGCGASVAATAVALVTVVGLGVTVLKKKED